MAFAMNVFNYRSKLLPKRYTDESGFLHVFLRVMRTGTLKYSPDTYEQDVGMPEDAVGPDGNVTVYVPPQE